MVARKQKETEEDLEQHCPQGCAHRSLLPPARTHHLKFLLPPCGVFQLGSKTSTVTLGISYSGPSKRPFRCLGLLLYCKNL